MSPATTEASSRAQALQEMANMDVTLMGPFKLLEEHPELDPAGVLRSGLAKESADLFLALGAPESLAHARRWWTLGAAFDNDIAANCAYALAHILLVKRYTDSDANIEEGLRWLIKAADAAHRDACALLGKFYEQGMGPGNKTLIDRDYRRALDYYTRPCLYQRPQQEAEKKEANSSPVPTFKLQTHEAQYRVSIILKNGYGGIPIDPARSLEWCHKAACNLSVQAVYIWGCACFPISPIVPKQRVPEEHWVALSYLQFTEDFASLDPTLNETFETVADLKSALSVAGVLHMLADPSAQVITPETTAEELLDMARIYAASDMYPSNENVRAKRQFTLSQAVAKGSAEASYELGRYFQVQAVAHGGCNPKVAQTKAWNFYFDAASQGHVLALLACAHLLQIDEPFQVAAYEILRKGRRHPDIPGLLAKLTPPSWGTPEFLRKEKADYAKAAQQIDLRVDTPKETGAGEDTDGCCCTIM